MSTHIRIDLRQWIPSYGENSVSCRTEGTDVYVVVEFDDNGSGCSQKELRFKKTSFFSKGAFPGVASLEQGKSGSHGNEDKFVDRCVIKYEDSKLAAEWIDHWKNFTSLDRNLSHYVIFFTSENVVINAICEEVSVS